MRHHHHHRQRQRQRQPIASGARGVGSSNRKRGRSTKPLFIGTTPSTGGDYFGEELASSSSSSTTDNLSFEAALGGAQRTHASEYASEYERDAEFYRKRNEDYSKSLAKHSLSLSLSTNTVGTDDLPTSSAPSGQRSATASSSSSNHHHQITTAKTTLKASFDHVESSTISLLKGRPLLALAIFCAAGVLVAYLSGFFFLEGYIENWNPVENDQIPYWEDAEIHTIQRVVE